MAGIRRGSFRANYVMIDGGREVRKEVIEVNSPLKYKGRTFYQSSYGMLEDATGNFIYLH